MKALRELVLRKKIKKAMKNNTWQKLDDNLNDKEYALIIDDKLNDLISVDTLECID